MSEVRWAVRVTMLHATAAWACGGVALVNKAHRDTFRNKTDALALLWNRRQKACGEMYKLVRITRKPRMSPEAKAARDALCAAAVAWWMAPNRTDVDETRTLNTAIRDYARSVTT